MTTLEDRVTKLEDETWMVSGARLWLTLLCTGSVSLLGASLLHLALFGHMFACATCESRPSHAASAPAEIVR